MSTLSSPPPLPVPDYIHWPHAVHRAISLSLSPFCFSFSLSFFRPADSFSLFRLFHGPFVLEEASQGSLGPDKWYPFPAGADRELHVRLFAVVTRQPWLFASRGDRRDDKRDANFTSADPPPPETIFRRFRASLSAFLFLCMKNWECYFFIARIYSQFRDRSQVLLIISFDYV